MPLVARKRVGEGWRDVVARRAGPTGAETLARFDGMVAAGRDEAEAAFRSLEAAGLLWRVDEPGIEAAPVGERSTNSQRRRPT